jgi:peptide/nickel transport system permease protein
MASSTHESATAESVEAVMAGDEWRPAPDSRRAASGPRAPRGVATVAGAAIMGLLLLMAGLGPMVYSGDPFAMQGKRFDPPSASFWLGTDYLGRDVLAGIVRGARTSLAVGVTSTAIILALGVLIGAAAGYYGGWVDEALMRATEFFQVLPAFLFAMVLVAIFSPTVTTIILAIGVTNWAGTARLARAEFLALKSQEFVLAARALGAPDWHIIVREALPNSLPPLVVNGALTVGVSVLFEAGLSFLGLGDANTMSWGYMIGASRTYLRQAWWPVTFPGLAIFATVLSLSLLGDALNDFFRPGSKARRRR